MMLTTKGRYAVMAVVDMQRHSYLDDKKLKKCPVSLLEIANRQEITLSYLEQIFSRLKAFGIVKSVRGPGGGYLLARSPKEITANQIISAADEDVKIARCGRDGSEGCMSNKSKCVTHDLWSGLHNAIDEYLSSITLEDIVSERIKAYDFLSDEELEAVAAH